MAAEKLQAARELIEAKRYEEARVLLRSMAEHPTAQRWLARLDEIDPPIRSVSKQSARAGTRASSSGTKSSSRYKLAAVSGITGVLGFALGLLVGVVVFRPTPVSPTPTEIVPTPEPVVLIVTATNTPGPSGVELTVTRVVELNLTVEQLLAATQAAASALVTTIPSTLAPTATSAAGKWVSDISTSAFDDTTTVVLLLEAENPIRAWISDPTPTLILRCQEGELDAYVVTGTQAEIESGLDDMHTARIRFDQETAEAIRMGESTDGDALFFQNSTSIIQTMLNHDTLLFGFTPFNAAPTETSFDLRGLSQVVQPLLDECK